MKFRGLHVVIFIAIAFLGGYYFGVNKVSYDWKQYKPEVRIVSKEPPASLSTVDFAQFWAVWDKVSTKYYDKTAVDPNKMLQGAITGMVQGVNDPFTMYLPPVQNTSFKDGLAGKFEGIGAELGFKEKQIMVVSPLSGSPAEKAGIKPSDLILKVNNEPTTNWTLPQAVDKIRGPKGTVVTLTVLHDNADKVSEVKITRDTITIKSVDGWVKNVTEIPKIEISKDQQQKSIMYIRLSQFGDNTNKEWLSLVNSLVLDMKKASSFKGVILDLRYNPGGYLTDAAFIASEFIKSGVVVTQDRGNGDTTALSVERVGLLTNVPVVVLINKGSASASEIVAGALRDYKRAKLLGETSFGKGTIQTAEDLGQGAGLHVTIAKWLTPNGTWVHGKGLTPDIEIKPLDSIEATRDAQLQRAVEELIK